jgi:hypothetical protein
VLRAHPGTKKLLEHIAPLTAATALLEARAKHLAGNVVCLTHEWQSLLMLPQRTHSCRAHAVHHRSRSSEIDAS